MKAIGERITCRRCKAPQNASDYYPNHTVCKKCNKETRKIRYEKNKEKELQQMRSYRIQHEGKLAAYDKRRWQETDKVQESARNKKWREDNSEHKKKQAREYHQRTKEVSRPNRAANCARRRASKINATPSWLTLEHLKEMKKYYILAKEKELLYKQKYHVDHIIPLQGSSVSGLHVPWNLQVISAKQNMKKGNKHEQ